MPHSKQKSITAKAPVFLPNIAVSISYLGVYFAVVSEQARALF